MKKGISQLIAILLIACIAFGCGFGGAYAYNFAVGKGWIAGAQNGRTSEAESTVTVQPDTGNAVTIDLSDDMTIAEAIAEKAMPSVVGISTVATQSYSGFGGFGGFGDFFGWGGGNGGSYDTTMVGTGVIVDGSGYILTNSHVVNDGDTKSVTVSLYDGSDVPGTVLWNDATLDLAVVKIEDTGDLVAAELGDSDTVKIGAYAAAIGNPLGLEFERSMSQGIISGLNRSIAVSDGSYSSSATTMEGLMQTDATINSGNSGGPLFNSKGEVIGINTAKASSGEGMGFAIPINVAKPIVAQVKASGNYERPYIGISGISLQEQQKYSSETLKDQFGTAQGIYVASVTPNGGAAAAGLQQGDVITAVNGIEVGTMNRLNQVLVQYAVGDSVTLTVMRDKDPQTFEVTLGGAAIFEETEKN